MKYLPQIAVAAVALSAGGFAMFTYVPTGPGPSARSGEPALIRVAATEKTQTFAIENMYCASCPIIVRRTIEGVAGVRSVKVDFASKRATVVYDPSLTTVEAIAGASAYAGYPATVMS